MSRVLVDSGIEWIGEIPEIWRMCRVKNKFNFHKNIAKEKSTNYDRIALTLNGVIKRDKDDLNGLQPENYYGYQVVYKDDLIFKLIDLENINTSRVGKSDYEGITSPAYIVLTDKCNTRYALYYFLNMWYQKIFNNIGGEGVRSALNKDDLLKIPYIQIEINEQKRIADYLDKKCSKIDEIIKDNNKEIVLLNEYKKSLINDKIHSFNSEMIKLKYLVNVRNEKGTSTNSEQFISLENIESGTGKYIHTKTDYTNCDGKIFKKGDLLINKLRPYLAKTYLAEFDGVCTGEIEVVSQFKGNINFLKYFTLSPKYIDNVNSSTYGTKMPRSSWDFIKKLEINLPSRNIQNQVVEYLDKQCSKLDEVIEYRKQIIEKLEEYKKSLIYECVTGKREV